MSNNPSQMIFNMLKGQMGDNPVLKNVIDLAEKGNYSEIEKIARNLCSERGINADSAFEDFKNRFTM
jgi:hydroxyethylthiazole kinase-like sugar kinase family protein